MNNPTGAHLPQVPATEQSDKLRYAAEALNRAKQDVDGLSARFKAVHIPELPGAVNDQDPRCRGERIQNQVTHAPVGHAEVFLPFNNPAAVSCIATDTQG